MNLPESAGKDQLRSNASSRANLGSSNGTWPVCVFAHNEEANIVSCLDSIGQASARHPVQAYVIANGCSDRTETIVQEYAKTYPWVTLVPVAVGDKSNAWNVFVHDVAPQAEVYFFMDGDVQVGHGAFDMLAAALSDVSAANGAAAVPLTGRNQKFLAALVCEHRLILGNLYALRGEFVRRMRSQSICLPIGYIGEDGLVTSLAKWNLDPRGSFLEEGVAPCPEAGFQFRSFSLWSPRDMRKYWYRRVRYSLRHFQHELLVPLLRRDGIGGMPKSVNDLYRHEAELIRRCRPRTGLNVLFDILAIRAIRNSIS
jgi:glycosyltransferase involved in cell wall biosynthesis